MEGCKIFMIRTKNILHNHVFKTLLNVVFDNKDIGMYILSNDSSSTILSIKVR